MANLGKCEMKEADKCYQISVLAISTRKLGQPAQKALCTLPLSHSHDDCWSVTNLATPSLHLILFSASLKTLPNFNSVHSEILFSQCFFCRPLLLPACTFPCKIVLVSPAHLDTHPNDFHLHFFTMVNISS